MAGVVEANSSPNLLLVHDFVVGCSQLWDPTYQWPKLALGPHEFGLSPEVDDALFGYERNEVTFVLKKSSKLPAHIVNFSLDLIRKDNSEMKIFDKQESTFDETVGKMNFHWDQKLLLVHFVNGVLQFHCRLEVRADGVTFNGSSLANDLRLRLLNDAVGLQRYSDFVLVCSNQEFPVHRVILASRSPVFEAMFEKSDSEEAKTGRTTITDIDPSALKSLLKFAYTDFLESSELTPELLTAADKYDFQVVFKKCEAKLIETLSVETAARYFLLAFQHEALNLKSTAKRYIVENYEQIKNTPEVELIATHYPKAMMELFEHSCQRK